MTIFRRFRAYLFLTLLLPAACQRVPDRIEPTLSYAVQDRYILSLPTPFPPLSSEEKYQDWGKEVRVGYGFARQLDLYQAITAFKRAEFLLPPEYKERQLEIQYEIMFSYYMARKWQDAVYTFEHGKLRNATPAFPPLHDLFIILYDSYMQAKEYKQAHQTLELIAQYFPEEAQKLDLSTALVEADFSTIETMAATPPSKPYLDQFLEDYNKRKKSIGRAQALNALMPGAGYLYLGQKQSAITAFLLNGLFIGTSVYFFCDGNIPAGVIFTTFEAGWYFGGIYGAGLEAKYYNERLYEQLATPMMNKEGLFPVLMLKYAF